MRAKESGQSAALLLDVIDILTKYNIPYAIIGAFAVSFYGIVRASMDADAIISLKKAGSCLNDLQSDLTKIGLKVTCREGDHDDPIDGVINIEDKFHNRVDLLLGIHGMSEDTFSRTTESSFMGATIQLISIEDLIAMKIFAGSQKDIHDVEGIFSVSKEGIDVAQLKSLVHHYGENEFAKLISILNDRDLN